MAEEKVFHRVISLDALRGFDMFWIMGGEAFFIYLAKATGSQGFINLTHQFHHTHWAGFRFYDLIFPLFMFISGVAIPYSIIAKRDKGVPQRSLLRKIFRRMILLVVFGIVYNGFLQNGFSDPRIASVLGQIGLAWFFASLIVLFTRTWRSRIFWLAGIWIFIAVLQLLVPVPGYGAGVITPEGSINAWIDQHFLPGHLYDGTYDPEGLLCIVSATTVTLLGAFAGGILRDGKEANNKKTLLLAAFGAVLIIVAVLLHPHYPIIKKNWTVPFDMLTAGISLVLLSFFYYIIDVLKWERWSFFFRVIGMNSITIYMLHRMVHWEATSEFFLGSLAKVFGGYGPSLIAAGVITLEWLVLYYLYKNKIFLRV